PPQLANLPGSPRTAGQRRRLRSLGHALGPDGLSEAGRRGNRRDPALEPAPDERAALRRGPTGSALLPAHTPRPPAAAPRVLPPDAGRPPGLRGRRRLRAGPPGGPPRHGRRPPRRHRLYVESTAHRPLRC